MAETLNTIGAGAAQDAERVCDEGAAQGAERVCDEGAFHSAGATGDAATGEGAPLLSVKNLKKSFGDIEVLKDVSFDVRPQEVIVLVGPSGCGKSTLLRCINGLETFEGGAIELDGEAIDTKSKDITTIHQRIGMVFQSYDLFPHKTVLDNVMIAPLVVQKRPKDDVRAEAMALLELVGLTDKANSYPRQLSGGQKQRVAIARALAMNPEILLLDEITAALDPEMVHEVLEVILDLARKGKTMIIVTHEMAFARAVADRIIFLDGGYICETAAASTFFDAPSTERAKAFLHSLTYETVRK